MRVSFCGVIEGSVTVRPGESAAEAIARAELTILDILSRHAKLLGAGGRLGPNVGLEPVE